MTVRSNYMVDGAPLARAARHPPYGRSVPKGTLGILFAGLKCYHVPPLPQGINEASGGLNRSQEPFTMHAIRRLRESGHATVADYEKLLAPNVVFHSPVLIRTAEGRAVVAKIFATSTTLREGAYTGEWKLDDRRTLLRWKGKIQGYELESFDLIEENDEGLIVDRTIAFRPMPAAKLFRDAMRAAMGSAIPDDYWEYSN
jgi:hypothetical protein